MVERDGFCQQLTQLPFLRFVKGSISEIDITELDRPIFTFLNKVL